MKVKPMMETGGMINDHLNYDEYSIDCINTYLTKNVKLFWEPCHKIALPPFNIIHI